MNKLKTSALTQISTNARSLSIMFTNIFTLLFTMFGSRMPLKILTKRMSVPYKTDAKKPLYIYEKKKPPFILFCFILVCSS